MKSKRLLFAIFGLVVALGVLASCDNGSHEHTFADDWSVNPTHHWHAATCEHTDEVADKAEHAWDNGEVIKEATCSASGMKKFTCVCGAIKEEEIAALAHTWTDADCDTPKTCSVCSATEGEALGHEWAAADCEAPKTCTRCELTDGEALGHEWTDADCLNPKTCSVCNATEGEALGHEWTDADCDTPKTCSVCSATEGEALGHEITASHYEVQDGVMMLVQTCSRCGTFATAVDVTQAVSVATAADLKTILTAGYDAVLTKSVDLETGIVIDKDVTLTINSGVTITLTNDTAGNGAFCVTSAATLTINGSGTVNGVSNNEWNIAVWAKGGHVVINGGTYTNVGAEGEDPTHFDLIYVSEGGSVTINGGTFIAQTPKWTLNIKDIDTEGKFVVKGGKFLGFNPAASETEPAGRNNNFLSEGYVSALGEDGYYTVYSGQQVSLAEAREIGGKKAHDTYTTEKYVVVGIVTSVANTQYGNLTISDGTSDLYIYGLYSADGKTGYSSMKKKPVVGDKIIVQTVLGLYGSSPQGKSGRLLAFDEVTDSEKVLFDFNSLAIDGTVLDEIKLPAAGTYGSNISWTVKEGTAITINGTTVTVTRSENDENVTLVATVSSGEVFRTKEFAVVVKSNAQLSEQTKELSFASKNQRTSFSKTKQVWEQNGITFTNDKASSSNNIADYASPVRLYQDSKVTIETGGLISKIVLTVSESKYATPAVNSAKTISGATVTQSGNVITIVLKTPVDKVSFSLTAQVRLSKIAVTWLA